MCRVHARLYAVYAAAAYFSRICSSHRRNRWSTRIGLRFTSRRSAAGGIGHLFLPLFVSHAFSLLRCAPSAPSVVRTSHASSRGIIHLSTPTLQPPCNHPATIPVVRSAMRIRRPDAWRTAISLCRVAHFFSPPLHSGDTCAKSEGKRLAVSAIIYDKAAMSRAGCLLSTYSDIVSNSLDNLGIYQNLTERRSTDRRDVLRNSASFELR